MAMIMAMIIGKENPTDKEKEQLKFEEECFTVHVNAPEEKGGRVSTVVDVSETQKGTGVCV